MKTYIKIVVYFNQQTHACACVHMVENNEKRYKIVKKVLFSWYPQETQVRLMQQHKEKLSFLAFRYTHTYVPLFTTPTVEPIIP